MLDLMLRYFSENYLSLEVLERNGRLDYTEDTLKERMKSFTHILAIFELFLVHRASLCTNKIYHETIRFKTLSIVIT